MDYQAINLAEKLSQFSEHWSPKIVSAFNDCDIMLAKFQGEFVWHKHDDTDDLFLVLDGQVTIDLEDGQVVLNPGELFVVPKGLMHRPRAEKEAKVLLIEPKGTPNTGDEATAVEKNRL